MDLRTIRRQGCQRVISVGKGSDPERGCKSGCQAPAWNTRGRKNRSWEKDDELCFGHNF